MFNLFSKRTIETIIFFDLDDTLVHTNKFMHDARTFAFSELQKSGLNISLEKLWELFWEVYDQVGANSNYHYNLILDKLNISGDKKKQQYLSIAVDSHRIYRDHNFSSYMETLTPELLKTLKQQGNTLGLISAGIEEKQIEKLQMLHLDKFFKTDLIYITNSKNKEFYEKIANDCIRKYNCRNIWMIGDREKNDITPANLAGFTTIRVQGKGRYRHDYHSSQADYKIADLKTLERITFTPKTYA